MTHVEIAPFFREHDHGVYKTDQLSIPLPNKLAPILKKTHKDSSMFMKDDEFPRRLRLANESLLTLETDPSSKMNVDDIARRKKPREIAHGKGGFQGLGKRAAI